MTPPNPSEAAREAADKISANDELVRGGWMPIGKFKAAEIIQSALDSALSASAARVKELEATIEGIATRVRRSAGAKPEKGTWRSDVLEECSTVLSIKVGETK